MTDNPHCELKDLDSALKPSEMPTFYRRSPGILEIYVGLATFLQNHTCTCVSLERTLEIVKDQQFFSNSIL